METTFSKGKDFPPMWLIGFAILAWVQSTYFPTGPYFGQSWTGYAGAFFMVVGFTLMGSAIYEIARHKTTFIPRKSSSRLVQSGVYSFSRNPDYLGDVLVLTGLIIWWGAALSLPLILIFVWVLTRRFIVEEELHLQNAYGSQFEAYKSKVSRWV